MGGKQPAEQRKLPPSLLDNPYPFIPLSLAEVVVLAYEKALPQQLRKLNPEFLHVPPVIEWVPKGAMGAFVLTADWWRAEGVASAKTGLAAILYQGGDQPPFMRNTRDPWRMYGEVVPWIPPDPMPKQKVNLSPEYIPHGLESRILFEAIRSWGVSWDTQTTKRIASLLHISGDGPPITYGLRYPANLYSFIATWTPPDPMPKQKVNLSPENIPFSGDSPAGKKRGEIPNAILEWSSWWNTPPIQTKMAQGYIVIIEENPPWKRSGLWLPQIAQWLVGWEIYQKAQKYTVGETGQDPPIRKHGDIPDTVALWPTGWNVPAVPEKYPFVIVIPENPPLRRVSGRNTAETWWSREWTPTQKKILATYGIISTGWVSLDGIRFYIY